MQDGGIREGERVTRGGHGLRGGQVPLVGLHLFFSFTLFLTTSFPLLRAAFREICVPTGRTVGPLLLSIHNDAANCASGALHHARRLRICAGQKSQGGRVYDRGIGGEGEKNAGGSWRGFLVVCVGREEGRERERRSGSRSHFTSVCILTIHFNPKAHVCGVHRQRRVGGLGCRGDVEQVKVVVTLEVPDWRVVLKLAGQADPHQGPTTAHPSCKVH